MFCLQPMCRYVGRAIQSAKYLSGAPRKFIDFMVHEDGVAVMTFQRPPVNSLNLEALQEMNKLLDEVANNKCKGVVLTSAIPNIFIAGLDIMEMYKPDMKRAEAFWKIIHEVWLKLYGAGSVTTAAINGNAPGAGCLIALSCEYRVMVQGNFKMGLNEAALGLIAHPWTMDAMFHVIPMRQAELALTSAKLFTVDEAFKVGIIDDIAKDKDDAINKCKEFIKKFDNIPPTARAMTKRQIREGPMRKLQDSRQKDLELFLDLLRNPKVQADLEIYLQRLKQMSLNK